MKDKIFIDTNIILYQFSNDSIKKNLAINILDEASKSNNYVISYQVIQEFSNVVLNKNKQYFTINELKSYIKDILLPICKFFPSPDFYLSCLILKNKFHYSYYDTLIISAALELNCSTLFSEDFQNGQRIQSLKVRDPFKN